ncbi:hypothetical protein IW150_002437, partial [Coemansia sp. RSA 2607]
MTSVTDTYTFEIVVRKDAYPENDGCAAEITAHFTGDETDPQMVVLHKAAEQHPENIVYAASLDVVHPKTISRVDFRVDGIDIASTDPKTPVEGLLPEGIVSVLAAISEKSKVATTAEVPVAGPLAALKNSYQIDSAVSSCADLLLSDIQNVSPVADGDIENTEQPADQPAVKTSTKLETASSVKDEVSEPAQLTEITSETTAEQPVDSAVVSVSDAKAELPEEPVAEPPTETAAEPAVDSSADKTEEAIQDTQKDVTEQPLAEAVDKLPDVQSSTDAVEQPAVEALAEVSTEPLSEQNTAVELASETPIEQAVETAVEHSTELTQDAAEQSTSHEAANTADQPASDTVEEAAVVADVANLAAESADVTSAPAVDAPVPDVVSTADPEGAAESIIEAAPECTDCAADVIDEPDSAEPIAEAEADLAAELTTKSTERTVVKDKVDKTTEPESEPIAEHVLVTEQDAIVEPGAETVPEATADEPVSE